MDLVIGIIFDVIATAALVYLLSSDITASMRRRPLSLRCSFNIIWSRRVQMIKTRKWRESIEKQMKNKDEKES